MIHQGEGLSLDVEAGENLMGVHADLDDLEGNLALDRLRLLRQVDNTHSSLTEDAQQPVRADRRPQFHFRFEGARIGLL